MIRSMTGFGQAQRQTNGYKIQVDVKSVNHRYCEINVRIPREWMLLENSLKKTIQRAIHRGKVDVYVSIERDAQSEHSYELNWNLANQIVRISEQLKERFSLPDPLSVKDLLLFPDLLVLQPPDEEVIERIEKEILECLNEALSYLVLMREAEGHHLYADIAERIRGIEQDHASVKELAPQAVENFREKLRERLRLIAGEVPLDEQRLVMEAALFAERINIDEELTRLKSHLQQFLRLLEESEPIGRKLDFLLQEMFREVNTIASKANDLEITNKAVNMKAELEKIREQVQNIE